MLQSVFHVTASSATVSAQVKTALDNPAQAREQIVTASRETLRASVADVRPLPPLAGDAPTSFHDSQGLPQADPKLLAMLRALKELYRRNGKEFDADGFLEDMSRFQSSVQSAQSSLQAQLGSLPTRTTATSVSAQSQSVRIDLRGEIVESDPLALDLTGAGLRFSVPQAGKAFDLMETGTTQRMPTAGAGTFFLALDRNGNGRIDDGGELFGTQHGAVHGFAELARFDANGDRRIDENDSVYNELRLVQDPAGAEALLTLAQAGVRALLLDFADADATLGAAGRVAQLGSFERADGSQGLLADVLLNVIV